MKYTAEEVRETERILRKHSNGPGTFDYEASDMLTAYAERIEADEGAMPTFSRSDVSKWRGDAFENAAQIVDRYAEHFPEVTGAADDIRALIAHPPAQAAQVDSANWFAGKYPTTTEPAQPADSVQVTDGAPIVQQLRGRAAFLRDRGRIKSPEIMERAADALEAATAGVPDGWRLVPVESTSEMDVAGATTAESCGAESFYRADAERVWSAMLAAAPSAPEGDA